MNFYSILDTYLRLLVNKSNDEVGPIRQWNKMKSNTSYNSKSDEYYVQYQVDITKDKNLNIKN